MTFKKFQLVILVLAASSLFSQDVKFGKISKEELLETFYEKDSSAPAAVLFRDISTDFNYLQSDGFHVITHVHERIKIYNKDGFDYATKTENLYRSTSDKESISGLKAYTYNLENGEVVKTKLKGSDTFSKSLNKFYNEEKFTMPNVKEGSVIEYQYRIDSPYSYSIDEIVLQYDIPIKKQEISVAIPEYYYFAPSMKGYLGVSPKHSSKSDKINYMSKTRSSNGKAARTNFNNGSIDYQTNVTKYVMNEVPALVDEPYVNDMDNYRCAVNYELQFVQFPESIRKDYTTTWEKVIKTIYNSDQFGKQLSSSSYFKEDLLALINGVDGQLEKTAAIFSHVQQRMTWNGYRGYYTDKGVKTAYKEKSGNTADINLILVAMLKEAGIEANPVLISTRDNGVPMFPTREGFNYVVVAVELNGNSVFLDASNKYTKPNLLPTRALNWFGRIIKEDGTSSSVSVFPKKRSREASMMMVNLNTDGTIEGKLRKSYTDYRAYMFRNSYENVNEEDYLEKFENDNNGIEVSNYEVKNKNSIGKPITESLDFFMDGQAEVIGNKLYFSPLFYNVIKENPFKLEERNYPIDYAYPWEEKYIMNISIPKGYKVVSLPKSAILALPDNLGSFLYHIAEKDNVIQLKVDIKMNMAVIPAENYSAIKELYKKVVEKETEKVVLSKISGDEHTTSTAGGR